MIRKLLIVTSLVSLTLAAYGQNKKKDKTLVTTNAEAKVNYREIGAPLPPVRFYTQDGRNVTNADLKNDANLLLMLFNPTCEHCEDQARILKENIFLFKKSKILLVAAPGMGPYLSYFTNNTKIDSYPTLQLALDSAQYIDKIFNYDQTLPQIHVYDKERKLLKTFYGSNPIDSLKMYIE